MAKTKISLSNAIDSISWLTEIWLVYSRLWKTPFSECIEALILLLDYLNKWGRTFIFLKKKSQRKRVNKRTGAEVVTSRSTIGQWTLSQWPAIGWLVPLCANCSVSATVVIHALNKQPSTPGTHLEPVKKMYNGLRADTYSLRAFLSIVNG